MKKIEDYLHLYLGCEVESNGSFIGVGKLTEVSIDTFGTTCVVGKLGNNYRLFSSDIKLILRPLSDMTEEEVLEACKLASPTAFGDYRFSKWQVNKDEKWSKHWKAYDVTNAKSDYSFLVDVIDGDIMLYDDGEYDPALMDNQSYRFWYLSKHFDLFNLIPEGLAIDKTKMK